MSEVFFYNLGTILFFLSVIVVCLLACYLFYRKEHSGDSSLSRREKLGALLDFALPCFTAGVFYLAGSGSYDTLSTAELPLYDITVFLLGVSIFLVYYAAAGFIVFLIRSAFKLIKRLSV